MRGRNFKGGQLQPSSGEGYTDKLGWSYIIIGVRLKNSEQIQKKLNKFRA